MPSTDAPSTALYRLYGGDGRLLYVGISEQLGTRWEQHMRSKPWWSEVQYQTAQWYPDRGTAAVAEIAAIQREQPAYNIRHAEAVMTVSMKDVEQLAAAVEQMRKTLAVFETNLGLGSRTAMGAKGTAPTAETISLTAEQTEKLLDDLDQILGNERMLVRDVLLRLRQHDPEWIPYQKLNGVALRRALNSVGMRVLKTGNRPRINPADLPKRMQAAAQLSG